MLAITHILVVILLIKLLKLDKNEAFAAMLFGVFIDLDHIFGMPEFIRQEGVSNTFNVAAALSSEVQWKSIIHQPVAALVVIPLSMTFKWAAPLIAWGSHIIMDWVQMTYLGTASLAEAAFFIVLAALIILMEVGCYREESRERTRRDSFSSWERKRAEHFIKWMIPLPRPRFRGVS